MLFSNIHSQAFNIDSISLFSPDEIYNKRPFDYVRITYKKEIKLGEKVNCKYVEQDGKYVIVIKSEDETVIHAIVELQ